MERLTTRSGFTNEVYLTGKADVCWADRPIEERAFCVGCHRHKGKDRTNCGVLMVLDRLAAIEDILGEEYNLDRLRELAQADRLIGKTIYRPGDPIKQAYEWEVTMFEVYPDTIVLYDDSDNTFCLNDIGKTVFLTREEAEAALATDC